MLKRVDNHQASRRKGSSCSMSCWKTLSSCIVIDGMSSRAVVIWWRAQITDDVGAGG